MATQIREPNFHIDLPGEWEQDVSNEDATLVFRQIGGDQRLSVTLLGIKPVFAIADRRRMLEDYMHHRTKYEAGQRPDLEQSEPLTAEAADERLYGEWSADEPETGRKIRHHVVFDGPLLADFAYENIAEAEVFDILAGVVLDTVIVSAEPMANNGGKTLDTSATLDSEPASTEKESPMATASARHILVPTEAQAEELKQQIADGADFAEVARANSTCPSSAQGGDLGTFRPGQMVQEFNDVCFNDEVGVVHGPVKTQFGYHLIEVTDRKD